MCMYYIYVFMYDQALNYNSIINSSRICICIIQEHVALHAGTGRGF